MVLLHMSVYLEKGILMDSGGIWLKHDVNEASVHTSIAVLLFPLYLNEK